MMAMKRFWSVVYARNLEFLRDRSALGWNIGFPVLVVLGIGIMFSEGSPDMFKVGMLTNSGHMQIKSEHPFFQTRYIQFIEESDRDASIRMVERHKLDMLIDPARLTFWINDQSPRGYMLERLLNSNRTDQPFIRQTVSADKVAYVDWLLPGVLAMNMMFSALYGVGYVIVRYRKNGVLKRLKATPLRASEFLAAQMVSRVWVIVVVSALIFLGIQYILGIEVKGAYLDLLLFYILGVFSVISLGMIVAARISSEEFANGVLNLVSWPMMFLSEVWFSLEGAQQWVHQIAVLFPLSHLIKGARSIMFDGSGLNDLGPEIVALLIITLVCMVIGAASFKWE